MLPVAAEKETRLREIPIPRPLSETPFETVHPVQAKGPHRLLVYYLVHSIRCLGHMPLLGYSLAKKPKQTLLGLMLYYSLRRTNSWNTAVHRLIRFGTSNRPRFIKAQKVPFDTKKQYVISHHPHGVLLCPWFSYLGREETPSPTDPNEHGFSTRMKCMDGLVVNLCFAPAVQFYVLHGEMYRDKVSDVSSSTLRRILRDTRGKPDTPGGESICVCPGGFSEAVYTGFSDTVEVAYIKGRYGIMKCAIEEGIDIIPTYSFGASDMYWGWDYNRHERAKTAQKLGLPTMVWAGKYGTNMPLMEDTVTVSFEPFPASQYSLDELELAHEDYCKYLTVCFNSHKGCCESTKNKEFLIIGKDDPPPRSAARGVRARL